MSQQNILAASVSALSLDESTVHTGGASSKKSRRPHRAYHNFSSGTVPTLGNSPYTTPQLNQQDGFQQPQAFTPKQFGGFNNGSGSVMSTPVMVSQERFGASEASSPYGQSMLDMTAPQPTSHIVPTQRFEDQAQYLQRSFETCRDSVPPLPTTQFYCVDQGSCDPHLMSLSMYNIPESEHLRAATKLPLGLTIQPFSTLTPNDAEVPTIPLPMDGTPLRCRRCRAYANPKFQFTYDSSVICNICRVKMQVPGEHFAPMGPNGQRSDLNEKSELLHGTVDFLVPSIYNAIQEKELLPLHYVFLIDVSLLANENGSSLAMVEGVRSCIEYISDFQPNCEVAIIVYDNKLRFFNLRPDLDNAQEYIVSELDDVFLPFYNGLFVKPGNSMKIINDTLIKISGYISTDKYSHVPQVCYGSALQAAKLALDTVTGGQGGKIICSLNSLPTIGNGNLSLKRDNAHIAHVKCDNGFYKKLASDFLKSYISLDLYVTNAGFIDMATVGHPVEMTSGILKYYPHFQQETDAFTLVNDMVTNVSNIVGYQALLKVRCSTGLSVEQYYCDSSDNTDHDPIIPVLTRDTTLDVLLKYDSKIKTGTDVHFQTALLYTDIDGVRKVRSINTSGAVSNNIREIFKFINQNPVMRIMIKDVIKTLGDCDFVKIRRLIDDKMVEILTQYRGLVSSNSSTQLILPDSIKTLPAYMLAFEKSELMKPNAQSTRGNERIYDLLKYDSLNSAQLCYKLYPQIVPFHVLLEETDLTFYDANAKLLQINSSSINNLSVRASHSNFINGGCYLIFQGDTIYLWFNENTNRMLLQDLLSVDESLPVSQISLFSGTLPETGTSINQKASNVIKNWQQVVNKSSLPLVLLRPNVDQYYSNVMSQLLCEDKTVNRIESYDNYLVIMHKKIQEKLQKDDFIKVSTAATHENIHQKFVQF